MAARDAYHSKALSELSPITSSLSDFLYLIKYSKWRDVTHIIRKPSPRWVRGRHHFPNRTSACCRFFRIWLNIQNGGMRRISFERPGRDEPDDVITLDIERPDVADFLYLIKYSKWRHMIPIIRKPSPSWFRWRHHFPIFCISLNIQNGGSWRISFESPRRDDSDDVITSPVPPSDAADFPYLIKYSKWRHVTHIIRNSLPSWVRWRQYFLHRTSGCRRLFVSH